ncbi:hypothetical protein J6590_066041 [Homalodisca vitripennis]|nr:hypothetical protein J6590_066041 [Homalodisca vitripennis]
MRDLQQHSRRETPCCLYRRSAASLRSCRVQCLWNVSYELAYETRDERPLVVCIEGQRRVSGAAQGSMLVPIRGIFLMSLLMRLDTRDSLLSVSKVGESPELHRVQCLSRNRRVSGAAQGSMLVPIREIFLMSLLMRLETRDSLLSVSKVSGESPSLPQLHRVQCLWNISYELAYDSRQETPCCLYRRSAESRAQGSILSRNTRDEDTLLSVSKVSGEFPECTGSNTLPIRGKFLMSLHMKLETRAACICIEGQRRVSSPQLPGFNLGTRDETPCCLYRRSAASRSTGFNACPDKIFYELAYETGRRLLVVCIEGQRRVSITSGAAQGPMLVPIRGIFLMSLLMKLKTRDSLLSVSKVNGVSGAAQGSMLVPIREIFLMSLLMRLETRDSLLSVSKVSGESPSLPELHRLAYETRDERPLVVCIEGQRRVSGAAQGSMLVPIREIFLMSLLMRLETRDSLLSVSKGSMLVPTWNIFMNLLMRLETKPLFDRRQRQSRCTVNLPIRGIFLMSLLMRLETRDSLLSVSKVSGVSGAAQGSMLVPIRGIFLMSLLMRLETRDSLLSVSKGSMLVPIRGIFLMSLLMRLETRDPLLSVSKVSGESPELHRVQCLRETPCCLYRRSAASLRSCTGFNACPDTWNISYELAYETRDERPFVVCIEGQRRVSGAAQGSMLVPKREIFLMSLLMILKTRDSLLSVSKGSMLVPIGEIFLMSLLMRLETRDSLLSVSKVSGESPSLPQLHRVQCLWNISYELAYETRDKRHLVVCIEGQRRVSGAAQGPMLVPIYGMFLMSLLMRLETRDSLLSVSKVSGVSGAVQGSMLVPKREIYLMSLLMRLETRDSLLSVSKVSGESPELHRLAYGTRDERLLVVCIEGQRRVSGAAQGSMLVPTRDSYVEDVAALIAARNVEEAILKLRESQRVDTDSRSVSVSARQRQCFLRREEFPLCFSVNRQRPTEDRARYQVPLGDD